VAIAVEIAPGFRGELKPVSVRAAGVLQVKTSLSPLVGNEQSAIRGALGGLVSLASGGSRAGFDNNFTSALATIIESAANLRQVLGESSAGTRSLTGTLFDNLA